MKLKYTDLKSRTRAKAVHILKAKNRTGGGEIEDGISDLTQLEDKLESLRPFELKLVKLYGEEWLTGFESGFDVNHGPSTSASSEIQGENCPFPDRFPDFNSDVEEVTVVSNNVSC